MDDLRIIQCSYIGGELKVHWIIEFGYVLFWFVCWQLIAIIYKRFLKFLKEKYNKDFDHDI